MKMIPVCILIMITLVFGNCSKNNNDTPTPTKTELLTRSSWKFKSATAVGLGDVSTYIPACYKDNLMLFVSNGTGSIDENTTFCTPPTSGPFTWSFQSNETQLYISTVLFTGGAQTFNFISVSETELVVSQTVTIATTSVLVTFTFMH